MGLLYKFRGTDIMRKLKLLPRFVLTPLKVLMGSSKLGRFKPTPKDSTPWTHKAQDLTLEQAKKIARSMVKLAPSFTRENVYGWQPFNSPDGEAYTEISKSRCNYNDYDQKLFSNLNTDLEKPNDAAFFNVELLPPTNDELKWYCRMSNLGTLYVYGAKIVGITGTHSYIPDQLRQYPIEHAFYCETVYGANFNDSLFEDLGGHGIYIPYRPRPFQQYPALNKSFDRKPYYEIKNVSLIDTDQDASRGSHSITFFDPGDGAFPGDILIQDTRVINGWDFERYQGSNERFEISDDPNRVRSCGPLVVTNFEEFPEEGWPTDSLTLRRCVFWSVKAKHSMGDIHNVRSVLIEDCFFRAEDHMNPYIIIGAKEGDPRFKAPEKLVIRNCKSDGVLIKLWLDEENFEIIDPNTVGTEYIWTR